MKYLNIFSLAMVFILASTTVTLAQNIQEKTQVTSSTKTLTTKVKGITCSSDLKTISATVEKLKGVKACKSGKTGPTTVFEISYNPALVTEKEIYAAIQDTPGCKNLKDRPYQIKQ